MITQRFLISGMHCAHCAMAIDDAVEELPGVVRCETDYAAGRAKVTYDPSQVSAAEIIAAIEEAGYEGQLDVTFGEPGETQELDGLG